MHLDVELALWRNLVEATAARIALHIDDAETVAGVLADTLETRKEARLNLGFEFFRLGLELFLFVACLLHYFVKLVLLLFESLLAVGNDLLVVLLVLSSLCHAGFCLFYLLVAEFYFQTLIFYLLGESVILAVVSHVVELLLVACHAGLRIGYFVLLCADGIVEVVNLCLYFLDTGLQSCNLVFKVLHFEREFAAQRALCVDG